MDACTQRLCLSDDSRDPQTAYELSLRPRTTCVEEDIPSGYLCCDTVAYYLLRYMYNRYLWLASSDHYRLVGCRLEAGY